MLWCFIWLIETIMSFEIILLTCFIFVGWMERFLRPWMARWSVFVTDIDFERSDRSRHMILFEHYQNTFITIEMSSLLLVQTLVSWWTTGVLCYRTLFKPVRNECPIYQFHNLTVISLFVKSTKITMNSSSLDQLDDLMDRGGTEDCILPPSNPLDYYFFNWIDSTLQQLSQSMFYIME